MCPLSFAIVESRGRSPEAESDGCLFAVVLPDVAKLVFEVAYSGPQLLDRGGGYRTLDTQIGTALQRQKLIVSGNNSSGPELGGAAEAGSHWAPMADCVVVAEQPILRMQRASQEPCFSGISCFDPD